MNYIIWVRIISIFSFGVQFKNLVILSGPATLKILDSIIKSVSSGRKLKFSIVHLKVILPDLRKTVLHQLSQSLSIGIVEVSLEMLGFMSNYELELIDKYELKIVV